MSTIFAATEKGKTMPNMTDVKIPVCKCGAPAHLVDSPRECGNMTVHFYGVECEGKKKHRTPMGFSTEKSALTFWCERYADMECEK